MCDMVRTYVANTVAMSPEVIAALIAAIVAVIFQSVNFILQVWFKYRDSREARKHEIMQHRRDALHSALQVIDHVYANSKFDNKPPTNPHEWNIALAWDAMNKMIVYCARPDDTVQAFMNAIGLHNPKTQDVPVITPEGLSKFRTHVCK